MTTRSNGRRRTNGIGSRRHTRPRAACAVEPLERRRLLTAGVPDVTFGAGGRVLFDFPGTAVDAAADARLQSDGKIVLLSPGGGVNAARLSRFTTSGALDATFGVGGSLTLPHAPAAFAVRADNKIVVASHDPADAGRVILARYLANGAVDTTFGGGDGQVSRELFGGDPAAPKVIAKMLVRPDNGRIYLAGNVSPADNGLYDWALAAYTEAGDLYPEFSPGTTTHWGYTSGLNDAILTPDNKILAVGHFTVADSHHPDVQGDFAVARYDEHGQLDPTFSGDGMKLVNFGVDRELEPQPFGDPSFDAAQAVAVDAGGKIVIAGFSRDPFNDFSVPFRTSVARLNSDGGLDPTFAPGGADGDGRLTLDLATPGATGPAIDLAPLANGRLLLATAATQVGGRDFLLARLTAAGAYDNTFGRGGRVYTDFAADDAPGTLLLQSGRPLLVGGAFSAAQSRLAMARYRAEDSTPFAGAAVALPGTIQAENFDAGPDGVAYHDLDAANVGGAYRQTGVDVQAIPAAAGGGYNVGFAKAGEWLEYTVSVAQAGDYDLDVRLASLRGGGTFKLEINGELRANRLVVPPTADWQKYVTVPVGTIRLDAGTHVLRLSMSGNDPTGYVANFDALHVTAHAPPTPHTPFGGTAFAAPGRLQLENYDLGGEGVAYHDLDAANLGGAYRDEGADVQAIPASSGGGHALAFAKAGEWTEYTFVIPDVQGASYDLGLRYAAPRGGEVSLLIDGQTLATVPLRATASWTDYDTAYPFFDLHLTPGTHVLRLSQVRNGAFGYVANYDYLEFQRYREPYFFTPFSPGDTIQTEDFDTGGEGLTYHDVDRANLGGSPHRADDGVDIEPATDNGPGGLNVGFARPGEWTEYTLVNPGDPNTLFGIDVRVASLRAGGTFRFELDGVTVARFTAPATGGWQTYTTLRSAKTIKVGPGTHRLRLVMEQANSTGYVANFNWFQLTT